MVTDTEVHNHTCAVAELCVSPRDSGLEDTESSEEPGLQGTDRPAPGRALAQAFSVEVRAQPDAGLGAAEPATGLVGGFEGLPRVLGRSLRSQGLVGKLAVLSSHTSRRHDCQGFTPRAAGSPSSPGRNEAVSTCDLGCFSS